LLGVCLRRGFDLPEFNGGGDGIARGTLELGSSMRVIQSGRIQQYMIVAIAVLVVVGLAFYYLVFMA
jgi:NADH-quinone oxidoreductase subunit L